MSTARPDVIDAGSHIADDGLFGPDSVTWKVSAHPVGGLVGTAAASIQMLYPPVMYMIDQASTFREKPELRARRTAEYVATITYGDVAAAEKAGETLRRIHARCKATDPNTGEEYGVDEPEYLLWVHNALVWTSLRAFAKYGPHVNDDERDQYVVEQHTAARLVGCDLSQLPSTATETDDYMRSMEPKLALSLPALWFKAMVMPKGPSFHPTAMLQDLAAWGSISLMGDAHRRLFGISYGRLRALATETAVKAMLGPLTTPVEVAIPKAREYVDENAFGARRHTVNPVLHAGPEPTAMPES